MLDDGSAFHLDDLCERDYGHLLCVLGMNLLGGPVYMAVLCASVSIIQHRMNVANVNVEVVLLNIEIIFVPNNQFFPPSNINN